MRPRNAGAGWVEHKAARLGAALAFYTALAVAPLLLMVIGIIGVLVVLLLPSVQAAREASRRATCANNLKQVGLALINVENTHGALPTGAKSQIVNQPTFGMSWWVQIIPYLEQSTVYARLDQTGPHNCLLYTSDAADE